MSEVTDEVIAFPKDVSRKAIINLPQCNLYILLKSM